MMDPPTWSGRSQCTWRCEVLPDRSVFRWPALTLLSQCTWRCEVLPDPCLWKPRHTATSRGQIATDPASTPRDRLTPPQNYHLSLKTSQAPPTSPMTPPATNFQRSHAEKSGSKRTKLCTVDQIATSPPHPTNTPPATHTTPAPQTTLPDTTSLPPANTTDHPDTELHPTSTTDHQRPWQAPTRTPTYPAGTSTTPLHR